jgi:hypothetical protein
MSARTTSRISTPTPSRPSRAGQRAQPVGIEAALDQRAERHVAGDPAEGIENGDAHQKRYDAPLPVLKTSTSASRGNATRRNELLGDGERAAAFRGSIDAARA